MRADHAPGHLLNILCAGAVQGPVKALQARFSHETGAVIYSGTPENVGPVVKGDLLVGHIDGLSELSVRIV